MSILRSRSVVVVLGVWALAMAACADSSSSITPMAPSALTPSSAAGTSGATIIGQVNGGSGLRGLAWTTSGAATEPISVTVEGTSIAVTVDSRGQFALTSLPQGTLRLRFKGSGIDARLSVTVGANEQITIAVTVSGSSATVESEHRSGPANGKAELEGRVTEIDVAARILRVSGSLVMVPATAIIRHGGTSMQLSDLKVGDRVHVKGTRSADGVQATEVNVQSQNTKPHMEIEGVVAGLGGTCPTLSFTVGGTPVVTDGSTFFRGDACADLENMKKVEVKGQRRADGSVLASHVESEDDDEDENSEMNGTRVEGLVSARGGTCPGITFSVSGTKVVADAATKFDGLDCAAVVDGKRVEVKGTRQANNDLLASKIEPNH